MNLNNILFGLVAATFALASCSDSSDDSVAPVETWPTYNETYSNNRLNLTLNEEVKQDIRVNLRGVDEGEVIVSPINLIYGLSDLEVSATAVETDQGWTIEGVEETDQYSVEANGTLLNSYIFDLDLTYQITDDLLGYWELPVGFRTNAAEFDLESELTEFTFLGQTINKTALESSVDVALETLVERYIKSLTFESDGTWNVVYYGRDELEGTLPDDLVQFYVEDDVVRLGIDFTKYEELDSNIRQIIDTAVELLLQGLPMTRGVEDSILTLTLERETLAVVLNAIETLLDARVAEGIEVDELLLNVVTDLNVILDSTTEFDISILLDNVETETDL